MTAPLIARKPTTDLVLSTPIVLRALAVAAPSDDANVAVDCSRVVNIPWRGYAADACPAAYLLIALGKRAVVQAEDVLSVVEPAGAAQPDPRWDRDLRAGVRSIATTARVLADACDEIAAHVAVTDDEEAAAAVEAASVPVTPAFGMVPPGRGRASITADLAKILVECEELARDESNGGLALACTFVRLLLPPDADVSIESAGAYIAELVDQLNKQAKRYLGHPRAAESVIEFFDLALGATDYFKALVDFAGDAARTGAAR